MNTNTVAQSDYAANAYTENCAADNRKKSAVTKERPLEIHS